MQDLFDRFLEQGVMCATQNQAVDIAALEFLKVGLERLFSNVVVNPPLLGQRDQRAGPERLVRGGAGGRARRSTGMSPAAFCTSFLADAETVLQAMSIIFTLRSSKKLVIWSA